MLCLDICIYDFTFQKLDIWVNILHNKQLHCILVSRSISVYTHGHIYR